MSFEVTKVNVWSGEIEDRPGGLADVLAPLAETGANLEFVLARRQEGRAKKGIVFLAPVQGTKVRNAAKSAGLAPTKELAALRLEGGDKPGLGHQLTRAIADAGVNLRGLSATAIGRKCLVYLAFDSTADANKAARALQALGAPRKKAAARKRK